MIKLEILPVLSITDLFAAHFHHLYEKIQAGFDMKMALLQSCMYIHLSPFYE